LERIYDQREMNEASEDDIEFVKVLKDRAKALASAK
jgi:hypothetical protein